MFNIVVLISGQGTNLQAIIDAIDSKQINAEIKAVISDKHKAAGLDRARNHEIPAYIIPSRKSLSREDYDRRLGKVLMRLNPDMIVLAGFMRILSKDLVEQFKGKMINIHPSLLPKYRGLNTHQRALDADDKEHGSSVHFVTPELDGGPVIAQGTINIKTDDTVASLSAKVQLLEHKMYPLVIDWLAQNRLTFSNDQVFFDGTAMKKPYLLQT